MKEFKVMRTRRRRTSFTTKKRRNYSFTSRRRKSYNKSGTVIAMILCAVVLVSSVCAVCVKFLSFDRKDVTQPQLVVADSCVVENNKISTLTMKNGTLATASSLSGFETLFVILNDENLNSSKNPDGFEIHVFPGKSNTYTIFEDDGITLNKDKNFLL